jgi:hypothetical protein
VDFRLISVGFLELPVYTRTLLKPVAACEAAVDTAGAHYEQNQVPDRYPFFNYLAGVAAHKIV